MHVQFVGEKKGSLFPSISLLVQMLCVETLPRKMRDAIEREFPRKAYLQW